MLTYIFLLIRLCDDPYYPGSTQMVFRTKEEAIAWCEQSDAEVRDSYIERGLDPETLFIDWRETYSIQEMRVQGVQQ